MKKNNWLVTGFIIFILLIGVVATYLIIEGGEKQLQGGNEDSRGNYAERHVEVNEDNSNENENLDTNNAAKFDATVETAMTMAGELMAEYDVPGMSIALVDGSSGFTWTHSFGYADTQNNIPVTEDTLFSIASLSKPFTAIAVMQLVEGGLIELDEPIVTYMPEFSMLPNPALGGNYKNITARMLLSHTSGIYPDYLGNHAFTKDGQYERFLNDLVDILSKETMTSEEGTIFSYANSGYDILGILVATVSGYDNAFEGFVNYTNEHIFSPAGMNRSTFGMNELLLPHLAKPHSSADTQEEMVFPNGLPGAGMFSTANDMAKFMHIILNDGHYESEQLLNRDSFEQMMRVHDFDFSYSMGGMTYGLGFMQRVNSEGFASVGHGGTLPYYHSEMVFDPESSIGVFVTVNSSTGISVANLMAEVTLQNAVYGKAGELKHAEPIAEADAIPVELTADELKRYEGFYQLIGERAVTIEVGENDNLMYIQHSPSISESLTPMSDGSFTNPSVGRLWFDEMGGEIAMFEGEYRTLAGFRGDIESFQVNKSLTPWFGTYYAIPTSEREVPMISHIEIGSNEFDIAIAKLFMPHINPETPMFELDGVWQLGGGPLDFTLADGIASFEMQGMHFERDVASE